MKSHTTVIGTDHRQNVASASATSRTMPVSLVVFHNIWTVIEVSDLFKPHKNFTLRTSVQPLRSTTTSYRFYAHLLLRGFLIFLSAQQPQALSKSRMPSICKGQRLPNHYVISPYPYIYPSALLTLSIKYPTPISDCFLN